MLGVHQETVKLILHDDLSVKNLNFDWLPHALAMGRGAALVDESRGLIYLLDNPTYGSIGNLSTEDIA
jgi:hypothetical protein